MSASSFSPLVSKFGGTSLATASQFHKVAAIISSTDLRRARCVVVSAPGKTPTDKKVTDLLLEWESLLTTDPNGAETTRTMVLARFKGLVLELGCIFNYELEFEKIDQDLAKGVLKGYLPSRGEYLCAKIFATAFGYRFVDAADLIKFDTTGDYNMAEIRKACAKHHVGQADTVVIPGFYGSLPDGSIKTFSRGGSDISGAIIAAATDAILYENWTDVPGVLSADPRIVDRPLVNLRLSYRELRELAYRGANVFHAEAMFPVEQAGIPTRICCTDAPEEPGTVVTTSVQDIERTFSGIASCADFCTVRIDLPGMNEKLGFIRLVAWVFERNGVHIEHMPSSIDSLSVIVRKKDMRKRTESILTQVRLLCESSQVELTDGPALIAVVGRGMVGHSGSSAQILNALSVADINIQVISQGGSELSVIVGVKNEDHHNAIRAIHMAFYD